MTSPAPSPGGTTSVSSSPIPSPAERAAHHLALMRLSRPNRFRLMFGQPFLPDTHPTK